MSGRVLAGAFVLAAALSCDDGPGAPALDPPILALEIVTVGLSQPVYATTPPNDASRLFVVERQGRIRTVANGTIGGAPFLDVRDVVGASGDEQGLLSMAFHPAYATNGHFFVSYTDARGSSRLTRYSVSADPNLADPASAEPFFELPQPFENHNGGHIAFGMDGMLYLGLGDGGSSDDPLGSGQNVSTLLGAMLRFDVDNGLPAIPSDNPFVGDPTGRDEIWATGLRNPWRFSFDRARGDLYIGDVGQRRLEEIDVQPVASMGGENYGWNIMEGFSCFQTGSCDQTGLTLPVLNYSHDAGACSVTGGYVYRGSAIPAMVGRYFYADFCLGFVRSFLYDGQAATDPLDHTADLGTGSVPIASFGEGADGELYVVSLDGRLFRIIAAPT